MNRILFILISLGTLFSACHKKEKIEFFLKKLSLDKLEKDTYPPQNYYLKVIESDENGSKVICTSDVYSSSLTLPANYGITPSAHLNFYKKDYSIELWGDSSQLISSNPVHLDDYKIIYPLEMETEYKEIGITLYGTWR